MGDYIERYDGDEYEAVVQASTLEKGSLLWLTPARKGTWLRAIQPRPAPLGAAGCGR